MLHRRVTASRILPGGGANCSRTLAATNPTREEEEEKKFRGLYNKQPLAPDEYHHGAAEPEFKMTPLSLYVGKAAGRDITAGWLLGDISHFCNCVNYWFYNNNKHSLGINNY